MKHEILNCIVIKDILDKYGIKYKRNSLSCPFHGKDKNPSATIYGKYFHCFACGEHLDSIGFVEKLFNLSFKEAMQKINEDFNLGLKSNTKIDYKKIKQIENERKQKQRQKQRLQNTFNSLCEKKIKYHKIINELNKKVSISNWENLVSKISDFQMKCELINLKLDEIDNILSSR